METMTRGRLRMIVALSSPVLLSLAAAQQATTPQPVAARPLSVVVERGRLSVAVDDLPLAAVVAELSSRTGVPIILAGDLEPELLSARLRNASIDQGIRDLLKNYDAFFFYSAGGQPAASLAAVWVYARGTAATLRPVPLEAWASTRDLEQALSDPDLAIRERGYEALMSRPDRASRDSLLMAIRGASETDPQLRQRLLSTALTRGVEVPHDTLMDLVRSDGAEEIRVTALDALTGDPAARDVAVAALTDPSEVVRERAKQFLAELDSLARVVP
jgi:hypothetical protein